MGTQEIVISKANAIRFANRESDDPFEALLSCEETYASKVAGNYEQLWFDGDEILLQIKAGLTATVVLTKYDESNTATVIASDNVETYTTFKVYEYLLIPTLGEYIYYKATSEVSEWRSEWQRVIAEDTSMMLLQWTNLDDSSNTFEFDYLTTLAIANVNYMRLEGEMVNYGLGGESTVYDNQNEKSKIKGSIFRKLTFTSERIPRQIAEIIAIATQHDRFLANYGGYIAEDLPEIEMMGGFCQLTSELTKSLVLGINTHDIGFDCDSISGMKEVRNIIFTDATGDDSGSVAVGFSVNQVLIKVSSGTVTMKLGNTVAGDEIIKEKTGLTAAMGMISLNVIHMPTDGFDAAWPVYLSLSGGVATVWVQTIISISH
jgi:hypothetical protein